MNADGFRVKFFPSLPWFALAFLFRGELDSAYPPILLMASQPHRVISRITQVQTSRNGDIAAGGEGRGKRAKSLRADLASIRARNSREKGTAAD